MAILRFIVLCAAAASISPAWADDHPLVGDPWERVGKELASNAVGPEVRNVRKKVAKRSARLDRAGAPGTKPSKAAELGSSAKRTE